MADNTKNLMKLMLDMEKLLDHINAIKKAIGTLNDVRMSDTISAQIKGQIGLLKQLQAEYANLRQAITSGTQRLALPPVAGQTFGNYEESTGRFRSTTGTGRFVRGTQQQVPYGLLPAYAQSVKRLPAITPYEYGTGETIAGQGPEISARKRFEEEYTKAVGDATKQVRQSLEERRRASDEVAAAWRQLTNEMSNRRLPDRLSPIPTDARRARTEQENQLGLSDFLRPGQRFATGLQTAPTDSRFTWGEQKKINEEFKDGISLAQKYGYVLDDLTSIHKESTTGISSLRFQLEKMPGIYETLNVTTDRYGNILNDTQKRFRSLGSTIARNIREVAKWTIAIQIIYGPMRKLSELTQLMIDNEAKLANITVAVGRAQADVNTIFSSIADVALATGESINGVIEGYELAYRAAGSAATENERVATTQQLLTDSMTLSKLSTLTQAEALDTLVGALKQTGRELTDGGELIDKWVQLSKTANVSVETLAESFAITATSATNAKLSLEELNAIVAIVAENTTLSATEAGNAVRAFISGFQTDKARDELSKYGVYLETASGEALGFYDVMKEISDLADNGIISQSELNSIGEAIGGGARRGAQVVATIKNLGDVQKYTAVQANAHGAAEEALSIQLETVRTKLTESSNAFQRLAQSMGTEGGLLSTFKILLDVINGIVNGITKLSETLGSALPTLIGFALVYNQLATNKKYTGLGLTGGAFDINAVQPGTKLARLTNKQIPFTGGTTVGGVLAGTEFGQKIPGIVTGGIATAVNAAINASQGEWDRAGGNIAGGIIGGLLSGGNPIGIAIGSSIGDAFVGNVLEHKPDIEGFFKDAYGVATEETKTKTEAGIGVEEEIFKRVGFGSEKFGNFVAAIVQAEANAYGKLREQFTGEKFGITRQQAALIQLQRSGQGDEYYKKLIQERQSTQAAAGEFISTADQSKQVQIAKEYSDVLQDITDEYLKYSREQIATGDISAKQFKDAKDEAEGLNAKIAKLAATFGNELIRNVEGISNMEDALVAIGEVVTTSSDEQLSYIEELSASVSLYNQYLDELSGKKLDSEQLKEQSFYMDQLSQATSDAIDYFRVLERESKITRIEFPSFTNLKEVTSKQDLDAVFEEARRLTRDYILAGIQQGLYGGLSADDVISTLEPVMVKAGGDLGYVFGEGFQSQFLPVAEENLTNLGKILGDQLDLKGFQDVSREQLINLSKQSVSIANQIKAAIPGYEPNLDAFIGIAKDGIAGPIVAEMNILQLLMKDLIDVNEKQLEGIYNLPTDASFYVPFTGYALGQGGGGDTKDIVKLLTDILSLGTFNQKETQTKTVTTTREERRKQEAAPTQFKENIERRYRGVAGEGQKKIAEGPIIPDALKTLIDIIPLKSTEKTFQKSDPELTATLNEISASLAKSDEINTNLTIEVNSTSLLQLDGQIVANVVKSYISQELLRQAGNSSVSRSAII